MLPLFVLLCHMYKNAALLRPPVLGAIFIGPLPSSPRRNIAAVVFGKKYRLIEGFRRERT